MQQYDIGDTVRCSAQFQIAGSNADPTTLIARVKSPTGVVTSYEYGVDAPLAKDAIGMYHLDLYPTTQGTWTYRFEGVGTAGAACENTFYVRPSAFYS